jgi:hypothetical protein
VTHDFKEKELMPRNAMFVLMVIALAIASMLLGSEPWGPF